MIDLYDYIALHDGAERAIGYIDRAISTSPNVAAAYLCFRTVAQGATICVPGCGFPASNRRNTATILRILYGGRDLETVFP